MPTGFIIQDAKTKSLPVTSCIHASEEVLVATCLAAASDNPDLFFFKAKQCNFFAH